MSYCTNLYSAHALHPDLVVYKRVKGGIENYGSYWCSLEGWEDYGVSLDSFLMVPISYAEDIISLLNDPSTTIMQGRIKIPSMCDFGNWIEFVGCSDDVLHFQCSGSDVCIHADDFRAVIEAGRVWREERRKHLAAKAAPTAVVLI